MNSCTWRSWRFNPRVFKKACVTVFICGSLLVSAGEPIEAPPTQPPGTLERRGVLSPQEKMQWLIAIERIRSLPRPGEIQNGPLNAMVSDIYDLSGNEKEKIARLLEAHHAELLKKAAQWEQEARAIRDAYQIKLIELLPSAKRETAKKLLDFSQSKWISPLEYENNANEAFIAERNKWKAFEEKNPDKKEEARESMKAWSANQKERLRQQEMETLKGLVDMLSTEEAARLDKFNRNRIVPQPEKK